MTGATPRGQVTGKREEGRGKREEGRGKREEVLGNFTFRYLCWFFSVHLLKYGDLKPGKKPTDLAIQNG